MPTGTDQDWRLLGCIDFLAQASGLILAPQAGKNTDALLMDLGVITECKTNGQEWNPDGWGEYERGLPDIVDQFIVRG